MKGIVVLFLSVLAAEQSSAKRIIASPAVPQYRYAVKVYNSFNYQTAESYGPPFGPPSSVTKTKKLDLLKPSVAFNWTDKKGRTREIELSSFILNSRKDNTTLGTTALMGRSVTTYDISLSFEQIFNFAKQKNWKLKPSLGAGVAPYFNMEKITPYTTALVPSTNTSYGARLYFAPRVNYSVSDRFFIDLNVPVTVADMGVQSQKTFVPAINSEMTSSTGNFNAFTTMPSVRIGAGLRI